MTLMRPNRTKVVCCEIERGAAAEKIRYFFTPHTHVYICISTKVRVEQKTTAEECARKRTESIVV